MALRKVINVIKSLCNPSRFRVIVGKVISRFKDSNQHSSSVELERWLTNNQTDFSNFAKGLNGPLWDESVTYAEQLDKHATEVLSKLEVKLGGGGFYPLIYFMTRYLKPKVVVETGVAAGYSSHAFLSAIAENKHVSNIEGRLLSSDFPYFRLEDAEKYIGILVPESLKTYWDLFTDGDEVNLPKIVDSVNHIDLFHYDSDKRYSGREKAMKLIEHRLSAQSIIIMDDINDNTYFMDICLETNQPYKIFEFKGKYIGMLGFVEK